MMFGLVYDDDDDDDNNNDKPNTENNVLILQCSITEIDGHGVLQ